ncbi:hypothetical protein E1B28_013296 [Marasmius oreades]|uniref:Uncharacterized protein n=1 Tax=Marasmius oreades TaxID=181124 RepID=A0A9P7UPR7_9AGAR|nr:uncharacterized protein E1B28_013296 [Marasmius oreades]KAG7087319.1 hypothetical protein E1B28_013296 [Marasmius oreades]
MPNKLFITDDERVKFPVRRRLLPQGNPFFVGTSVDRTPPPSSTQGSNAPNQLDKSLADRLNRLDQRSLLTGVVSSDMDATHCINAVRDNEDLRTDVEHILNRQRILGSDGDKFELNGVQNLFLVEANFHRMYNLRNGFAIVPITSQLQTILAFLQVTNVHWNFLCRERGEIVDRPLSFGETPAFKNPTWRIFILEPRIWFNDGRSLDILQKPHLYSQDPNIPSVWEPYVTLPADDHALLRHKTQNTERKFIHSCRHPLQEDLDSGVAYMPTTREESQNLSVLAFIINAQDKFRHAECASFPTLQNSELREASKLCGQIVDEFYYLPNLAALKATPTIRSSHRISTLGRDGSQDRVDSVNGSSSTGTVTATRMEVPGREGQRESEVFDGYMQREDEVDEEDGRGKVDDEDQPMFNSYGREYLLVRESKMALAKVNDPNVPVRERVELFNLVLRGVQHK